MSLPRIALSLILTLSLSGAPVVQALAMAVSSAPYSAGLHAGHANQQDGDASASSHQQHNKSCTQHDFCNGSCCANCAQCYLGISLPPLHTDVLRPVMTPSVYHLTFSAPIAPRDRPPRAISL